MANDEKDLESQGAEETAAEAQPDAPPAEAAAEAAEAPAEAAAEAPAEAGEPEAAAEADEPEAPAAPPPPPKPPVKAAPPKPPAKAAPPPPPPPDIEDDGKPEAGGKRPGRFSRRSLLVFGTILGLLVVGGGLAGAYMLYTQRQAEICAAARKKDAPASKIRECWECRTQDEWKTLMLDRIAERDLVELLDIAVGALGHDDSTIVAHAANVFLYQVQSPDPAVRAKVAELKNDVIKKKMEALKGTGDTMLQRARAVLALTLVYLEDVAGLEVSIKEAATQGMDAFSTTTLGYLANKDQAFFDGILKLAEEPGTTQMGRLLSILQEVDYSGRDNETQSRRDRVITLLKKVLAAGPESDVELEAIMCWAETGDGGALERVAEYFDRAAEMENGTAPSDRAQGQELATRAEQIFQKVRLRYGAEKLVDLYGLIKKNRLRQEKILYLVRELHDPRPNVRDFLLKMVEDFSPREEDGGFSAYLSDNGTLTHRGNLYVNAVFALAEILDERAARPLRDILNKFNTMVTITDEQANLYNAGLLILGAIAVRTGGPLEAEIASYIFELSDPDKYPERWMEKRAGKLRVLSFIAGDMWSRFLKERPECRDDIDPVTTLAKKEGGCPTAMDLQAELPPPPLNPDGSMPVVEAPPPPSAYEELPEMQKRRERERLFDLGEKTLDETKHEELRWVFDSTTIDVKQKIYYFTKLFACPIEITMVSAMMDRNDQRVKQYERWCGDYGAAAESMARLAHYGSASIQREARQFLAGRLEKSFLKYPGTQEPIQYDQYMDNKIYNFVMYRQAIAKALGYLGTQDPKLLDILKTVVYDETDHPQVGRYAGVSLGIVADGPALEAIVDDFISPDTVPDVRGYLLKAIDGHFRFAPLNELSPQIPEVESRVIDKLGTFLNTYEGGFADLPASRIYLLGVLFGSMATRPEIAAKLADMVQGASSSKIREVALLGLICSAVRDVALPLFQKVYGEEAVDEKFKDLRSQTTLKTLRDVYTNVGTPNDPYTIPVRSALEIQDGTLFRRLQLLHALRDLGQKDYLDYYTMRMALALGVDKNAMDQALAEAGLEAAEKYTPIAYKLSYRDNFTYYETPYLTWVDTLFAFAADPNSDLEFRKYAVELLWRVDERGYVYSVYTSTGVEGVSAADRELHDYVYDKVMRQFI